MAHTTEITVRATLVEGTATEVGRMTLTAADAGGTEYDHDTTVVAANATDFAINMVGVATAKHLVLSFSAACTVKLNGTGETEFDVGAAGFLVLSGFEVTSIHVTTGSAACTVKRIVSDGT